MRKTPYQVLQRPIITEKGLDVKEKARTLCFQVHHDATKVEIREAVQKIFKSGSLRFTPRTSPASCGAAAATRVIRPTGRRLTSDSGPERRCPNMRKISKPSFLTPLRLPRKRQEAD
jgi:ribosomal protein L23